MKRQLSIEKYTDESNKKLQTEFSQRISCLESLSNELLCEIFDYFEGCTLFESFGNLNSRFQSLIQSPFLQLKFYPDWKVEDRQNRQLANIVLPNRHNIISLKLFKYCSSLIERSLLSLDSSFHRLQYLNIQNIEHDDAIIPFLTNLTSSPQLSSITLDFLNESKEIGSIYQIIFNMPVLKYSKVSFFWDWSWDSHFFQPLPLTNTERFSQIKYLNIDHAISFNELISIFFYIPELCRLMCSWITDSNERVTTNFPKPIKTLKHITFDWCDVEFDTLANFFSKISPNIEVIRLNISDNTDPLNYLDPDKWEKLITNNLQQLRTFNFMHQKKIDDYDFDELIFPKNINRFNSTFWTEHNWIFRVSLDSPMYLDAEICLTYSVTSLT